MATIIIHGKNNYLKSFGLCEHFAIFICAFENSKSKLSAFVDTHDEPTKFVSNRKGKENIFSASAVYRQSVFGEW